MRDPKLAHILVITSGVKSEWGKVHCVSLLFYSDPDMIAMHKAQATNKIIFKTYVY